MDELSVSSAERRDFEERQLAMWMQQKGIEKENEITTNAGTPEETVRI